ncbi:MerR family transcriptional regulator [Geomicrobium sp. JSM 1781026]|uniref:MerR family transcriptional regulator n=1 Tax=Geomicrobium sp. JSM 1781026 TaxID=3344580 RepID=UPI0035C004AA
MYSIREFSKRTGVSARTLRFYEELEVLLPEKRNASGHRVYGLQQLAELQQIQSLKFVGYSLQEIKRYLHAGNQSIEAWLTSLPTQKQMLLEKRSEIDRAVSAVEHVHSLLGEGTEVTWTMVSALLQEMEHEEERLEWMREHLSEEVVTTYTAMTEQERAHVNRELLLILSDVKQLMKDKVAPESKRAQQIPIRLTELMMQPVPKEEWEAYADELERVLASDEADDFRFPSFWSPEEERYVEKITKALEQ